jgi:thiol:disulfide interchange protein DsbC
MCDIISAVRKKYSSLLVFIVFLCSFSFPACAQDAITPEKAAEILKEAIPDVKVLETRQAPVKGLTEVTVESKGQKGLLYLDSSGEHLISGSIVQIKGKRNLTQERFAELTKVNVSEIPLKDAIAMGDKKAPKKVIVFTDPD